MKRVLLALLLMPLFTNAQDTAGLIAHWAMNGDAKDLTGKGHNGNIYNVIADTGRFGVPNGAYRFNGVNSYISVPYSSDLNVSSFSICALINIKGFFSGECQVNSILYRGSSSTSSSQNGHYSLVFDDNPWDGINCFARDTTKDVFVVACGNNYIINTDYKYSPTILPNHWYNVVGTYDGTYFKVFFDGSLVLKKPGFSAPIGNSSDSLVIGFNTWEAPKYSYPLNALIDDIRLYNRALSDSEAIHYGDTCGPGIITQPMSVTTTAGSDVIFTINASIAGASYQWQQNTGVGFVDLYDIIPYSGVHSDTLRISGATTYFNGSSYRCLVSNSWGCGGVSDTVLLTTTGIAKPISNDMILIYPIPVHDKLTIQFPYKFVGDLQLINTLGQIVLSKKINEVVTTIDMNSFANGVYILKSQNADGSIIKRITKK